MILRNHHYLIQSCHIHNLLSWNHDHLSMPYAFQGRTHHPSNVK